MKSYVSKKRTGAVVLSAMLLLSGAGLLQSCDKDELVGQPSWLGNSIYEQLQADGNYKYTLRLIDDLDQKAVLSQTGSKTLFVADDNAFADFYANNAWGAKSYDQLTTSQKKLLLNSSMLNNAYLLEMMSSTTGPNPGQCLRRETSSTVLDSVPHFTAEELPTTYNESDKDYWKRFRSSQGDSIPDNQQMGFEQSLAIFPIIVPSFDTILCHQANNIRVADITDSSVTLIWDSRDPGPWELAYANINATSWDNATVLSASSPSITINGLTPGTTYIATVRTFCQPNGDFGDWCDAVDFTMLRSNAIQPNDDPDHFTHLLPNPATNRVSILSSYSLSHIDIYNLDGRQMLSQDCNGHSASLRLDDWPDGSYIVVIRSSAGSTTKKLTISH